MSEKIKILVGNGIGCAWSFHIKNEWDDETCKSHCTDRIKEARLFVMTYQPVIDALEQNCSYSEFEVIFEQMRTEVDVKFGIRFGQFFDKDDVVVKEVIPGEFVIVNGTSGDEYLITKDDFDVNNFWKNKHI